MQSKKNTGLIGVALFVIIAVVAYVLYSPTDKIVTLQGQVEANELLVSSKVPGRIDNIAVKKGDHIKKGDFVFSLYSPEIDAKLTQAEAGKSAAAAIVEQAQTGARVQQVEAAKEQWNKARVAAELYQKTYVRVNSLYEEGVVPLQKKDESYTQWKAGEYTEKAARQMYEMAKEGARKEQIQAAEAQERMADGAIDEVKAYQSDTKIYSWFDGEVSNVVLFPGEIAPAGFPVVTVVDMSEAYALLTVREDLLSHFKEGTLIKARIPALSDQLIPFKVSHIAVMGDYATWRATDHRQGYDLKTFEVEIRPVEPITDWRAGMSVLVDVDTDSQ